MDRDTRREVNAQLVGLVLEIRDSDSVSDSEKAAQLLATGRAAALRLRHSVMQPEQRIRLADALEELGFEKEAERLAQSATGGVRSAAGVLLADGAERSGGSDPASHRRRQGGRGREAAVRRSDKPDPAARRSTLQPELYEPPLA